MKEFIGMKNNLKCVLHVYTPHHQVHCLDVTAGGLGVSSDSEGQLKVWETQTGDIRVSNAVLNISKLKK